MEERVRGRAEIEVPKNLKEQVRAILDEHRDLRWDDAIQIVLDKTQLDRVRAEKLHGRRRGRGGRRGLAMTAAVVRFPPRPLPFHLQASEGGWLVLGVRPRMAPRRSAIGA